MPDAFTDLVDRLQGVRLKHDSATALCPAHDDSRASLSVGRGANGRVLITCHAGCRWQDVLAAVGMEASDAFGEPRLVREYVYTDRDGRALYVVERWEPKTFRQRLANGSRRAPRDVDRVVYNLPVLDSIRNGMDPGCFFVEGEKDVETLANLGYAATTTLGGANKPWQPQYTEQLAGLHVVIVADSDATGRKWAHTVAGHLNGFYGTEARIVVPPRGFKDVTELIEAGGSVTELVPLAPTIGDTASAADIPMKVVEWLWPGRLPAHMLTLLEGDPGTGKSTLAVEMVSCLTTGRPFPGTGEHREPMTVAMLADEDNWSVTVVPRLKAAGADLRRVHHLRGIRDGDSLRPYSLMDLSTLRHDLRVLRAQLLVIDPLVAYFGSRDVDTHRDQHVRSILGPLVQMAEEAAITILAIRHFTKGSVGSQAIYRGGGSIGFTGQARAVLQTAMHPDQDDEDKAGLNVLAVAKCNLAPLASSLGYRLTSDPIYEVARVRWENVPVPLSAQQLQSLKSEHARNEPDGPADDARTWLDQFLRDGEPHKWSDIVVAAKEAGIAPRTAERVRYDVAVRRLGPGGNRDSVWISNRAHFPLPPGQTDDGVGRSEQSGDERDYRERQYKDADDAPEVSHFATVSGVGRSEETQDQQEPARSGPISLTSPHSATGLPLGKWETEDDLAPALRVDDVPQTWPESTCRICGTTDDVITYPEPVGGRCAIHNPEVWSS